MKFLVTGCCGYLGSVLASLLISRGHEVIGLDRGHPTYGFLPVAHLLRNPRFELIEYGLMEAKAFPRADGVAHLAAIVGDDQVKRVGDAETTRTNIDGTRRVARETSGRLVFASTCSNYGVTSESEVANVHTPLKPLTLYALTKTEGEQIVLQTDREAHVLRLATLMGYSPAMRWDLLVNEAALCVAEKRPFVIYRPEARRPFLHVYDAAMAFARVLEGDGIAPVANVVCQNVRKADIGRLVTDRGGKTEVKQGHPSDLRDYAVMHTGVANFHPTIDLGASFAEVYRMARAGK